MPVPPKEVVQSIIANYREPIVTAVLGAWKDWLASPHVGTWRCKRSRANFVWEQIIERAHIAFDGLPGVHILGGQETFKFLVEDRVLFRFKKGDDTGLTANVPTQLALAFHDHDQNLLGLHEVYRVEVVYKLNRLETQVVDVIVVARDEDKVAWSFNLLDITKDVVSLPILPSSDVTLTLSTRRLVRPRNTSDTQDGKRRD